MQHLIPERRGAMYHAQAAMGATMDDADGWQLPAHFGDPSQEAVWLKGTVGVSDVSSMGKVKVAGADSPQAMSMLVPTATDQATGSVIEGDSPLERGGKLLSVRLASDEYLLLTPPGVATSAVAALQAGDHECSHAVDITSGLCGLAIVGPAVQGLMSRITEVDTSPRAFPDLTCVQSRFADVQALLLRRDVNGKAMYQMYASREFGEYFWEVIIDAAKELGGGAVGTEALLGLRERTD